MDPVFDNKAALIFGKNRIEMVTPHELGAHGILAQPIIAGLIIFPKLQGIFNINGIKF